MNHSEAAGRILVVDDLKADRCYFRQVLQDLGHEIIEAIDGVEALEMAAELKPDLVLLDVMMPGIDGYEVCRSLRDDPDTHSIPVFMISALVSCMSPVSSRTEMPSGSRRRPKLRTISAASAFIGATYTI